jgi:site-specific DNA-methyltransferase (adenine-specific)
VIVQLPTAESPVTLVRGDCLHVLAALPAGSVALIFADPPYFLSTESGTTVHSGKRVKVDKGSWDRPLTVQAQIQFHLGWLTQVQRVLAPHGSLFATGTHHCTPELGVALKVLGFHLLNDITWAKPNPPPHLAQRFLCHSHERVLWASPKRTAPLSHYFDYAGARADNAGKQLRDVWLVEGDEPLDPMQWRIRGPQACEQTHGHHATQKPLALMERIIRYWSKPGDVVLDPFLGSGGTGVAALRHGRRFIGIELDRDAEGKSLGYMEIAQARIAAELEKLP